MFDNPDISARSSTNGDPSLSDVWSAACQNLIEANPNSSLALWLKQTRLVSVEAGAEGKKARVIAANGFVRSYIEQNNYRSSLEQNLCSALGEPCQLDLSLAESPSGAIAPPTATSPHSAGVSVERVTSAPLEVRAGSALATGKPAVDPRLTFENFVVGASNQFAHAGAVAIAERPGRQYNPFFIYSAPGLGKTHLLHAIGNHLLAKNPSARIAYFSAEAFVNEFIVSLAQHSMAAFHRRYREGFDILLVDDVQFFMGKTKSEEEFFHTFNALLGTHRQIVLSSDRPPKDLNMLEERVRTRFSSGLIADIHPPEIETRIALLRLKADLDDIYLPDEVCQYLATQIRSNVRDLHGVLVRLQAKASLNGAEINEEIARQIVKEIQPEGEESDLVETIQNAVAKFFEIRTVELKSPGRKKKSAAARHLAIYLSRRYTKLGFREIGERFGGRDHSTIVHAYEKIAAELESSEELKTQVSSIQNLL